MVTEVLLGHMLLHTPINSSNKDQNHEVTRDVTVGNCFSSYLVQPSHSPTEESCRSSRLNECLTDMQNSM